MPTEILGAAAVAAATAAAPVISQTKLNRTCSVGIASLAAGAAWTIAGAVVCGPALLAVGTTAIIASLMQKKEKTSGS